MRAGCVLSAVLATACSFDVRGIGGDDPAADAPTNPLIDGAAAADAPPSPDAPGPADAAPPDAGAPCGPTYVYLGGGWYRESTDPLNWYDAEVRCETEGAHLAVVSSDDENSELSTFSSLGNHWIGLSDRVVEGTFRWVTGDSVAFEDWNSGEPNNSGWEGEDCAVQRDDGSWNDENCNDTNFFLCECDGVPVDPSSF